MVRLRQRRLFQGCAILLLLPTAAAFLPVQGRAPQTPITLVPVTYPVVPIVLPSRSHPVLAVTIRPLHKLSRLSGIASWYGDVWRGHRTANGERFDPNALTACHPSLPFGTLVKVINLENHRSVLVRINDRSLLMPNRVIDLSSAAAEQLDMIHSGIAPVRLEVQSMLHRYDLPPSLPSAPPAPALN